MKLRTLLVLPLLLVAMAQATAQTDSFYVWNKWCARRDTLLLFNAGNNQIHIYCKGMKPDEYKLKSLDKSLRIGQPELLGDTMSVLAMPYPGKDKQMRLAILNAKTSKVIKTLSFTSDSIPQPVAQVGSIDAQEAPKKTILNQNKLRVVFPKSLYNYPYSVKQYSFRMQTARSTANFSMNGFFLTTNVMKEVNEAPEGTVLEFYNIKATCPECALRELADVRLKIK